MKQKILISIVTPTYNRAYCIVRAINSVKNLTIPEGMDYEHIIINDGSTDNTDDVVKRNKYGKIRYSKLKSNQGVNAGRNRGIELANGDYILLYDSDDELLKDSLIKIKKALEDSDYKYMIYRFLTKDSKTKKLMSKFRHANRNITYKQRLSGGFMSGEFISVINKKVFDKFMYDENRFAFEAIFWNKVSREFKSEIIIPKVIRLYHSEEENRLCKKLLDPKYAQKRVEDYKYYLKEFEKDYLKFGFKKQLVRIYFTLGFYLMLAKEKKEARVYFKKGYKDIKSVIAIALSYLGSWPFRLFAKVYSYFA